MSRTKKANDVEVEETLGNEKPTDETETTLPVEPVRPKLTACPRDGATRFQVVHFGSVTMDGEVLNGEVVYVCVTCHGQWKLGELAEHRWKI